MTAAPRPVPGGHGGPVPGGNGALVPGAGGTPVAGGYRSPVAGGCGAWSGRLSLVRLVRRVRGVRCVRHVRRIRPVRDARGVRAVWVVPRREGLDGAFWGGVLMTSSVAGLLAVIVAAVFRGAPS